MTRYFRLIKNISNWWLHFAVKLGLTDNDPLLFRTRSGINVEVPRRLLHEFKEIFMEGCYTKGLASAIPETPTVIDIGANAGFFSLFAASRFPGARIFSYEPVDVNYKQLLRNRALNQNIGMLCFKEAVFGYSGEISLCFDPRDSVTTAARVAEKAPEQNRRQDQTQESTIRVPCVTLKDIFDAHRIERCDLLKIDCEGSEYDILYNCPENTIGRIGQMAIEVHQGTNPGENITSLAAWLEKLSFATRCSDNMLRAWQRL